MVSHFMQSTFFLLVHAHRQLYLDKSLLHITLNKATISEKEILFVDLSQIKANSNFQRLILENQMVYQDSITLNLVSFLISVV